MTPLTGFQVGAETAVSAVAGHRRIFVRDFVIEASVGVRAAEHQRPQPVRINVMLFVPDSGPPPEDELEHTVSYSHVTAAIRALVAEGHVKLLETLAERLAARCLADPRVARVTVQVEKLDRVPEAASVGVIIERLRPVGAP